MILLVTYRDEESGQIIVSHGIDTITLKNIILPPEPLNNFNAKFNRDLGEYVLMEDVE